MMLPATLPLDLPGWLTPLLLIYARIQACLCGRGKYGNQLPQCLFRPELGGELVAEEGYRDTEGRSHLRQFVAAYVTTAQEHVGNETFTPRLDAERVADYRDDVRALGCVDLTS